MLPLTTQRLRLRSWRPADREPFAQLNGDPLVMAHFPAILSRAESDALLDRLAQNLNRRGFGFWAVEEQATGQLIGFVGLNIPGFEAHFTPAVEVGWRLARPFWGQGYATEAARCALKHGFEQLGLTEIVSFTVPDNWRSRAVMERLGMTHNPQEDFDHPLLPGHRLERHVLYRLSQGDWQALQCQIP